MSGDLSRAEILLREIVMELVSLPLDDRARRLHLKVLAMKQVISGWSRQPPPDANREAMVEALEALRLDVLDIRSTTSEVRLRSTQRGIAASKGRR
jgi:hypothetical protein